MSDLPFQPPSFTPDGQPIPPPFGAPVGGPAQVQLIIQILQALVQATNLEASYIKNSAVGGVVGGDLSGSLPNPVVTKINGNTLGSTIPTAANLLIGSGAAWVTEPVTGDATITSAGVVTVSSAVLKSKETVAANGLSPTPLPLTGFVNTDGSALAAAAAAGKFGYSITLATSFSLVGEAANGNTKTDDALFEFALPSWLIAGQNITVTVYASLTGTGTAGTHTAQIKAYRTATTGAQGANLGPGATNITAGGADITFTITGATLNPGDRVVFELETVLQETGGINPLSVLVGSVRVS